MRIINFLNLKGGVAKTFSVVNMAYELWRRGYKVLILDNDKQGNLSKAYRKYDAEQAAPVTRLLSGNWECPEELIQRTDYGGIDIVSSNMSLFGAVWNLLKSGDSGLMERYQRFMELVKSSGEKGADSSTAGGYDYCLIDNPPDIGLNVINALAVADEVIVPVKIDEDAITGLDIVAEQIEDAKALNPSLTLSGVLVTVYQKTDGEKAGLEWLRREYENPSSERYKKYPVLGMIRYSKKVAENSFLRKPIYEYSPCSGAAQDYKKFVTSYTGKGR
ncbi:MAG: ParA family protein [Ruminococcus sp.]|nr:ParA family protein [Ruminococcus sp.]